MNYGDRDKLEQLGLSSAEAEVYLAVLHHGPLAAAGIANETGIPRTSVYPVICSLADKGLVEGGISYGSKFAAVAPSEALPLLVAREKETISERERIANELAESLAPLAAEDKSAFDDTVQVIRTPQVITDRLDRLQLEVQREVKMFVKGPILNPRGNPSQAKAQRRGVLYRCVYERAVLDDPRVGPYVEGWIAGGEEARVYDGELPYKVMVFDSQVVLVILAKPSGQSSALIVRHGPFATSISILFDSFWAEATPLIYNGAKRSRRLSRSRPASNQSPSTVRASGADSRNHTSSQS